MLCLGFEPGVAGWKAQTNPLSNGGTLQTDCYIKYFLHTRLFSCYFSIFKETLQFFFKKKQCPSSIWCWNTNPSHPEHESSPKTTGPGLSSLHAKSCYQIKQTSLPFLVTLSVQYSEADTAESDCRSKNSNV